MDHPTPPGTAPRGLGSKTAATMTCPILSVHAPGPHLIQVETSPACERRNGVIGCRYDVPKDSYFQTKDCLKYQ